MILDNYELSTIHYTLFYYLDNANLDEDDLIEEVTTASGWCIKSIDYEIQLK